jgi:trimethylamine--corrinoid protein Co-methyltransferase
MTDIDKRTLGLPHYGGMSPQQLDRLHEASLEILERVGVRFYDAEALALFKRARVRVTDDTRVHIPAHLVEWALRSAPKNITIYNRHGERAMELGGYRCYFGVGSDCSNIYDLETGQRRTAVLNDVVDGVKLVDALPNIDFVMSMFMPSDVPIEAHERYQMSVMLQNSCKPIVFVGEEGASTLYAMQMAAAAAGGLDRLEHYPFVINYVNTLASLRHNEESVRRVLYAAEHNLPTVFAPGNGRGTTSVMTAAGAMAMGSAGLLSGLVLAQLKREGAPFIINNPGGTAMDLRTMVNIYNVPDAGAMGWQLAHYYRLPIFGTAGCSDAKVFDAQAAADAALTLFANALAGANLIHDVGYLDCAMTGSLELVAFCDEVIGWLKRYLRTPEINEETLALDTIIETGTDGSFLETKHTLRHMREDWRPSLFDRLDFPRWEAAGATTLQQRANKKVREIVASHSPAPLSPGVVREIESAVRALEPAHG